MNFRLYTAARPARLVFLALACVGLLAPAPRSLAHARTSSDIVLSKSGDEAVRVGGQITYTISVYNAGPDTAGNVQIVDQIPEHTTYVSASSSQGTVSFSDNTLFASIGPLEFDMTATVTLVVKVDDDTPRGTVITNTAHGAAGSIDPDSENNSATAQTVVFGTSAGDVIISEFRLRGPGAAPPPPSRGVTATRSTATTARRATSSTAPRAAATPDTSPQANDEFIELYNNTDSPIQVEASDNSFGWSVAASDGVTRFIIPNFAVIPARGHFLAVNMNGYSLGGYRSGNDAAGAATATGDTLYSLDIPDNAGIALFTTSEPSNYRAQTRLDAVGSNAETNPLYKEGNGYPALSGAAYLAGLEHSLYRDLCGKGGSTTTLGACPTGGVHRDSNDNAADFIFVDTQGEDAGAGRRLGAPGPENLSSPPQRSAQMPGSLLDASKGASNPPNRVREFQPDLVNNSAQGTLDIRRRIVNATGDFVTRLRFRVIDITTFPTPSGFADLRARTSSDIVVSGVNDPSTCGEAQTPCTVTVVGTALEQPPAQQFGGGFNSSLSADSVTLAQPLAPGAGINVRFLLGVQRGGTFKFIVNVEAISDPNAGGGEELSPPAPPPSRPARP